MRGFGIRYERVWDPVKDGLRSGVKVTNPSRFIWIRIQTSIKPISDGYAERSYLLPCVGVLVIQSYFVISYVKLKKLYFMKTSNI